MFSVRNNYKGYRPKEFFYHTELSEQKALEKALQYIFDNKDKTE